MPAHLLDGSGHLLAICLAYCQNRRSTALLPCYFNSIDAFSRDGLGLALGSAEYCNSIAKLFFWIPMRPRLTQLRERYRL
jgi:hypothetical protein